MMTDGRLILETENKLLKKLKILIAKRDKLMPAVKDFEAINIDIGDMDGSIKLLKSEADKAHQEMIDFFHKQADLIWEDVKPMLAERDFYERRPIDIIYPTLQIGNLLMRFMKI